MADGAGMVAGIGMNGPVKLVRNQFNDTLRRPTLRRFDGYTCNDPRRAEKN